MKRQLSLLILCMLSLLASGVYAQKKDPQTSERTAANGGQTCPSAGVLSSYHWDNGKGDDLTVDVICVGGAAAYVSTKLTQSKKGANTEVANPGGTEGAVDTGHC